MVFERLLHMLNSIPSYIPYIVGCLGLYFGWKGYRRKTGALIRGNYQLISSTSCQDQFVTSIILENQKDRAITIFAIYLRVGFNYYVELENLDDKPLLLKAYESYKQDFGPIHLYGFNDFKFDLNELFADRSVRKRIVLSTSEGKYVVPSNIQRWHPIRDHFRNHTTAVIRQERTYFKEQILGSNIKFLLEMNKDGKVLFIQIPTFEWQTQIFQDFRFTSESLETVKSLNIFLHEQLRLKKFTCQSFTIHDVDALRESSNEFYSGGIIKAEKRSFFEYYVLGWLDTKLTNRREAKESSVFVKKGTEERSNNKNEE